MTDETPWTRLTLTGLDGANPLAFLASLGTLQTAASRWNTTTLHWTVQEGGWTPVLNLPQTMSADELSQALHDTLKSQAPTTAFQIGDNLTIPPKDFRNDAEVAQRQAFAGERRFADFMTSFGCETTEDRNKRDMIEDTALRTMSGAGHQHFLASMRVLESETTAQQLHTTLFDPWHYQDPKPSMRWDAADDRRYALRWADPSKDAITTMRGANRLAIEALALMPTMPQGTSLATTGFTTRPNRHIEWSWPIWETPIPIDVCRSLLALAEIQVEKPSAQRLRAMGITAVYRSRRITIGQFRNFTPAEAVA